jgi:T5SS/PEP-CTERM-associated repeat protein/autotransporter-associated beta strand protein
MRWNLLFLRQAAHRWTTRVAPNLTATGTGTLTLIGVNTYAGNTTVDFGTLAVQGPGASINGYSTMSVGQNNGDNGTLLISNGGQVNNLYSYLGYNSGSSGTVTVTGINANGTASTWDTYNDLTVGNSGTGNLTIEDGGQVTNADSYIGNFEGSGTVLVTGVNVNGTASTWSNSGPLEVGAGEFGTGALTIQDGGQVTSSSPSYGASGTSEIGFSYNSSGTVTVTGVNTNGTASSWINNNNLTVGYLGTGTLTVQNGGMVSTVSLIMASNGGQGTLNLNSNGVLETSSITNDGGAGVAAINFNGGILRATASSTDFISAFTTGEVTLASGGGTLDNNGYSITVNAPLAGTGALTSIGAGTLILTGTNTYAGATTVNAGILQLTNEASLYNDNTAAWTTTNIVINSGATLALNVGGTGQFTLSDLNTLLTLGTSTGGFENGTTIGLDTTDATGGNFTYSGTIANPNGGANIIGLTKLGTGTLTLTGLNTYTGLTTVSAGELDLNTTGGPAITGNLTVNGGTAKLLQSNQMNNAASLNVSTGTFDIQGYNQSLASVTLTSGTIAGSGGTLTSSSTFNIQAGTASANLGGSVGLTKTGTGTAVLSGTNTYTGLTSINAGILNLGGSGALGGGGNITFGGGTLQYSASNTNDYSSQIVNSTNAIMIDTNGQNVTYASGLAGNNIDGLTKLGSGTLTLSGTNAYTGLTTVSGGTLSLTTSLPGSNITIANSSIFSESNTGGIGGSGVTLTQSSTGTSVLGGTNTYTGLTTVSAGTLTLTGSLTGSSIQTNGTGIISQSSTGMIGGSGVMVTQNSTAASTLSGTNTYTGITTVNAGTLEFANEVSLYNDNTAAWTPTNIVVNSGATLAFNVGGTGQFTLSDLTTLLALGTSSGGFESGSMIGLDTTNVSGGNLNYGNVITNPNGGANILGLTKLGTGTLTLTGLNTYTGMTTVSAGELDLNTTGGPAIAGSLTVNGGTAKFLQAGQMNSTANLVVSSGILNIQGYNQSLAGVTLTGGSITGSGGTLTSSTAYNIQGGTVSANLGGSAGLIKTGTGTAILSGTNTYTGNTTVDAGALNLGSGSTGSLNSTSTLVVGGNGTFTFSTTGFNSQTVNGLDVTAGLGTIDNSSTFSQAALTLGAIARSGSGMVDFGTMTGNITTTSTNTNGIIGPWAFTGTGTSLKYAVSNGAGNPITSLTGTTATPTTLANVSSASSNYVYSAAATTTANLTGNTLQYTGGATTTALSTHSLTLNGLMNTGSGLLTITGTAGDAGMVTGSNGELDVLSDTNGITISAVVSGTGALVYGGPGATTGTLTLSGINTYSGGTVINSGTVTVGSAIDALGSSTNNLTLATGATLNLNGHSITVNALNGTGGTIQNTPAFDPLIIGNGNGTGSYAGTIQNGSGAVGLTKEGTGTQTLTGTNSYSGGTSVNGGKLLVNGTNSTGSGQVTVASGGTLGGTGTITPSGISSGNAVTIQSGGTLNQSIVSGGLGTSTLTLALNSGATVNLVNGATFAFNLGATGASDQVNITGGTLTLNNQNFSNFTFTTLSGFTGTGTYDLFVTGGSGDIMGSLGTTTGSIGADTGTLSILNSQDLVLTVTSGTVPEPSTWAMLLGGLALLAFRSLRPRRARD